MAGQVAASEEENTDRPGISSKEAVAISWSKGAHCSGMKPCSSGISTFCVYIYIQYNIYIYRALKVGCGMGSWNHPTYLYGLRIAGAVLLGTMSGRLLLWNLESGKILKIFRGHRSCVEARLEC